MPPPKNTIPMRAPTTAQAAAQVSPKPSAPRMRFSHFFMGSPLPVGRLMRNYASLPHRRPPTLTQLTLDAVAAFEGCVQAGNGVGHQTFDCMWSSTSLVRAI